MARVDAAWIVANNRGVSGLMLGSRRRPYRRLKNNAADPNASPAPLQTGISPMRCGERPDDAGISVGSYRLRDNVICQTDAHPSSVDAAIAPQPIRMSIAQPPSIPLTPASWDRAQFSGLRDDFAVCNGSDHSFPSFASRYASVRMAVTISSTREPFGVIPTSHF